MNRTRPAGRAGTVAALGAAQTLAWASTYYLPAILAGPMARDLAVSVPTVFAAFSAALLVSAVLGPYAGRAIDRWGGRPVLMATNIVFALGLAGLGASQGPLSLFAAWAVLGIGMGSGLYEAAFAALVHLYGKDSRNVITGITLVAGFASTIGWPLSSFLELQIGWRGACFTWAILQLVFGLPLNAALPKVAPPGREDTGNDERGSDSRDTGGASIRVAVLLSVVFAITLFISTAMAAHLPGLLMAGGATLNAAVAVGALIGPAQVGARLLEFGFLRHVHPLLSTRLAALLHPIGATVLIVAGSPMAAVFAVVHGAGNGILTIAKGTLPLVLFGPLGYGARTALLMVPARIAQALAPWLFGLCIDRWGLQALWLSAGLGITAFVALLSIRQAEEARP